MEREEQIKKVKLNFDLELSKVNNLASLNELKVTFLGKKSSIVKLSKILGFLDVVSRKVMGALFNES